MALDLPDPVADKIQVQDPNRTVKWIKDAKDAKDMQELRRGMKFNVPDHSGQPSSSRTA